MEGLRQNHCVASYADRVAVGHCAVAVVFVDRDRWTVELRLSGNEQAPLTIAQMRGPNNAAPSRKVQNAIYDRPRHRPAGRPGAKASASRRNRAYMANLRRVLPVLRQHGITHVIVYFSGGGDSGQIDQVYFTPHRVRSGADRRVQRSDDAPPRRHPVGPGAGPFSRWRPKRPSGR